MNYKIENGISGPIIIFNDGLKQETHFDIPNNILNIIKELEQDNRQLELKLQQKQYIINKAKELLVKWGEEPDADMYMQIKEYKEHRELLEILDNKGE